MTDLNNRGFTIWFTGLPCSGKTTLAEMTSRELLKKGFKVEVLDGEVIRRNLSTDLAFSKADRDTNIRRIGFICQLLSRNGIIAIVSAVSPYRAAREEIRKMIGCFVEVYLKCPLATCIKRDCKGLYKKALAGDIKNFTGIADPYEEPFAPEVIIETDGETPEQGVTKVLKKIKELGYLPQDVENNKELFQVEEIYSVEEEEKIKKRLKDLGYI